MKNNKYKIILLLILFLVSARLENGAGVSDRGYTLIKYLPSQPSYALYIKSLKSLWKNFESSYFWKKYKLTKNGKELDKTINSLSATFIIIGLTFDDLLEIFSGNSLLALWVSNNYLTSYLYIIKSTKIISQFIERLNYYAIANKIQYIKYKYNNYDVINFSDKVYIAYSKKFTIISDNKTKLELTINNTVNNSNSIPLNYDNKFFKGKNIILWNNMNKSVLYSIEFSKYLTIEALSHLDTFNTNATFNYKELRFVPSNVNFISFSYNPNKVKQLFLPLFTSIDTNFLNIDTEYFDTFFDKINPIDDTIGTFGMKITSKKTNILFVFKPTNNLEYSNYIRSATNKITYHRRTIYKLTQNPWKYLSIYDDYILMSNNLNFLKSAFKGYRKRTNFYYSPEMRKILSYLKIKRKSVYSFVWMNLRYYIIKKAFLHPKDKWTLYNAYRKTFSRVLLYSYKTDMYFYTKLKTYSIRTK